MKEKQQTVLFSYVTGKVDPDFINSRLQLGLRPLKTDSVQKKRTTTTIELFVQMSPLHTGNSSRAHQQIDVVSINYHHVLIRTECHFTPRKRTRAKGTAADHRCRRVI